MDMLDYFVLGAFHSPFAGFCLPIDGGMKANVGEPDPTQLSQISLFGHISMNTAVRIRS